MHLILYMHITYILYIAYLFLFASEKIQIKHDSKHFYKPGDIHLSH